MIRITFSKSSTISFGLVALGSALAQVTPNGESPGSPRGLTSLHSQPKEGRPVAVTPDLTPAQARVVAAQKMIDVNPLNSEPYNELAMALARRARETGDAGIYDQATEVLNNSFRISPDNLAGQRVEVWLLLGKHDFAQALVKARALNLKVPDDTLVYALLADAAIEMGKYDEAEKAVQWSFDIRPGEISGLTRGAYLRELFGDLDGAIELMDSAYQRTALSEVEDRAWILVQIAQLHLLTDKIELAEQCVTEALQIFPKYHYALACLARVRTAQMKFPEAVEILEDHFLSGHSSESVFMLAEALKRAGSDEKANAVFAFFEKIAIRESAEIHNHNRELITYYSDYACKPAEALRLAEAEAGRRQDVKTLDSFAWALFVNGETALAQVQIDRVLKLGVRDPIIFYHAGRIAAKAGKSQEAESHFLASISQSPKSPVAGQVRTAIKELHSESANLPSVYPIRQVGE